MAWIRRLRALFRKEVLESDFEEELQFHLSMREQRNVEQGMSNAEAVRSARLRFGNLTVWRERMREIDLMLLPQTLMQDLRFGGRMLLRNAGFTALAVFALAVGIGLDTAAFTAYRAFFERTLDAHNPASMVNLTLIKHTGETESIFSYPFPESAEYTVDHKTALIRDLRARIAAMPGVLDVTSARAPDDGEFRSAAVSLNAEKPSPQNRKAYLFYTWIQPNYFQTLGIPMLLGRGFTAQGGQAEPSIVVSESAENPVGRTLRLGTDGLFHSAGEPLPDGPVWRVIGVARDTRGALLDSSDSAQIYLPLSDRYLQNYPLLVRTRSDPAQLMSALGPVMASVDTNLAARSSTLEQMLRQTEPFLASTLAAAIASTTGILGLLLAAIGIYGTVSYIVVLRTREVGIRVALGAKKGDILALILSESTRPVFAGLSAGVVLASGVAYLLRHVLYGVHTIDGISFAGVSLLFLVVALLAALIPSQRALRVEPVAALRCE